MDVSTDYNCSQSQSANILNASWSFNFSYSFYFYSASFGSFRNRDGGRGVQSPPTHSSIVCHEWCFALYLMIDLSLFWRSSASEGRVSNGSLPFGGKRKSGILFNYSPPPPPTLFILKKRVALWGGEGLLITPLPFQIRYTENVIIMNNYNDNLFFYSTPFGYTAWRKQPKCFWIWRRIINCNRIGEGTLPESRVFSCKL